MYVIYIPPTWHNFGLSFTPRYIGQDEHNETYGLKRFKLYYISLHILRGYVYSFLSNFPETTFIQGAMFIPDSRVYV